MVVPLLALLALVACADGLEPLPSPVVSPEIRPPTNDSLGYLIGRRLPINSSVQLPPVPVYEDSSPTYSLDLTVYSVGNNVSRRPFLDYPTDLQIIMPGEAFADHGKVTSWSVFAGRDCLLTAQVLEKIPCPRLLELRQQANLTCFILVGENTLQVFDYGLHTFHIPPAEQIEVNPGHLIAFHTKDPGCVSYSDGGSIPVMYRYGHPERREHNAYDVMVAVGSGLVRTYSLAATGKFQPHTKLSKKRRAPPSFTPTPSPSVGTLSATASYTPYSLSPSLTPIYSSTPSESPSPSTIPPSASVSPSYTPSSSAVWFYECAKGVEHVCATEHLIDVCGMSVELCLTAYEGLQLDLPAHLAGYRKVELEDKELEALSRMPTPRLLDRARVIARDAEESKDKVNVEKMKAKELYEYVRSAVVRKREIAAEAAGANSKASMVNGIPDPTFVLPRDTILRNMTRSRAGANQTRVHRISHNTTVSKERFATGGADTVAIKDAMEEEADDGYGPITYDLKGGISFTDCEYSDEMASDEFADAIIKVFSEKLTYVSGSDVKITRVAPGKPLADYSGAVSPKGVILDYRLKTGINMSTVEQLAKDIISRFSDGSVQQFIMQEAAEKYTCMHTATMGAYPIPVKVERVKAPPPPEEYDLTGTLTFATCEFAAGMANDSFALGVGALLGSLTRVADGAVAVTVAASATEGTTVSYVLSMRDTKLQVDAAGGRLYQDFKGGNALSYAEKYPVLAYACMSSVDLGSLPASVRSSPLPPDKFALTGSVTFASCQYEKDVAKKGGLFDGAVAETLTKISGLVGSAVSIERVQEGSLADGVIVSYRVGGDLALEAAQGIAAGLKKAFADGAATAYAEASSSSSELPCLASIAMKTSPSPVDVAAEEKELYDVSGGLQFGCAYDIDLEDKAGAYIRMLVASFARVKAESVKLGSMIPDNKGTYVTYTLATKTTRDKATKKAAAAEERFQAGEPAALAAKYPLEGYATCCSDLELGKPPQPVVSKEPDTPDGQEAPTDYAVMGGVTFAACAYNVSMYDDGFADAAKALLLAAAAKVAPEDVDVLKIEPSEEGTVLRYKIMANFTKEQTDAIAARMLAVVQDKDLMKYATEFPAPGYESFADYPECMATAKGEEPPKAVKVELVDEPIAVAKGDKDVAGSLSFSKCKYSEDMKGAFSKSLRAIIATFADLDKSNIVISAIAPGAKGKGTVVEYVIQTKTTDDQVGNVRRRVNGLFDNGSVAKYIKANPVPKYACMSSIKLEKQPAAVKEGETL